jgi:hypothetical protein
MNVQGPGLPSIRIAPPQVPARPPAPPAPAPRTDASAPAAPAPSFLDLLTSEEREFFAQQTALGPLTYGPRSARPGAEPGPLGQRIDVKG